MTSGYLSALVERHTAAEPAVAPRARSAFEPDAATADPFDSRPSASPSADPWGMEEADSVAEPRPGDAPRRTPRRRIRALAPEPMDEIVAPDPGPAPLAPPAPRRPRASTESTEPAVPDAPTRQDAPRGVDATPAAHPTRSPAPPSVDRPAPRGNDPHPPASVEPLRPAPRRVDAPAPRPAADPPLPRIDTLPSEPARRDRRMDAGRSTVIHPESESVAVQRPVPAPGRREMDVRPAEEVAPTPRAADWRPAAAESAERRRDDEARDAAAPVPAPPPPPPSIVMVQPVVRSAPLPAAVDAPTNEAPAPAPVIEVSIGRIEVRATQTPAAAPAPVRRAAGALSLDDYLRRRGGGR